VCLPPTPPVAYLFLVRPMRVLAFLVVTSFCLPAIAADKTQSEPQRQPDYVRGAEGWFYACWMYPNSRAIHGRLRNNEKEVFGKRNGETIKTTIGTLVWRGNYAAAHASEKSTGWLFVQPPLGPPFIFDAYDPKTNTLRH
jgi:hypothetical protein